jgi:hypothetical protein
MDVMAMTGVHVEGRHSRRRVVFLLLVSASVLIAVGLAILLFWLFPVVERTGGGQLIGQNPIGFWLVLAGATLLAASLFILVRSRRAGVRNREHHL